MTKQNLVFDEIRNKGNMLRKMAIPAVAVIAIVFVIQILRDPYLDMKNRSLKRELGWYVEDFVKENNEYLKSLSEKIKSEGYNPISLSQLQSKMMLEQQKVNAPKRFIWMSDVEDNFIFGVPKESFTVLNNIYQKYPDVIKKDAFYKNKSDFLTKLVDVQDNLDFSVFEQTEKEYEKGENARFYTPEGQYMFFQPYTTSYSTQVFNSAGNFIGILHMKVNDKGHIDKYYSRYYYSRDVLLDSITRFSEITFVLALVYLWFLLPTWVYADAVRRNVKKPLNWALLVLVTFVVGFMVYIIVRPSGVKTYYCPKCMGELNGMSSFCPHCGLDLSSAYCRHCHYLLKEEWKFCPECRAEIKRSETKPGNENEQCY